MVSNHIKSNDLKLCETIEIMTFKIKPKVDKPALDALIQERTALAPTESAEQTGSASGSGIIFRMTAETAQLLDFVYQKSTIKSKQKLLEAIILPELKRQAEKIKQGKE